MRISFGDDLFDCTSSSPSPQFTCLLTLPQLSMNGLLGFILGVISGLLILPWVAPSPPTKAVALQEETNPTNGSHGDGAEDDDDEEEEDDEEEDEEEEADEEAKMVLVVRKDLKLSETQSSSACCTAALRAYESTLAASRAEWKEWLHSWERAGTRKVALRGNDEAELLAMTRKAEELQLPHAPAHSASKSSSTPQLAVLAIGPAPISTIDGITGHLRLY
eukprot:GGOE01012492.1.p3 GENE.GGOE01012492.1~~GGOE01012492.1.p3  ORF type:complete len:220 (-),score=60.92 GGOE01012492.1:115-774(-)